ncbi:sensor histidine kinase [Saccharothrix sp. Mg75]|uniref:sensor histidine kinase n=1 Tax=Saccharothrix sp. Mg75 TaxID=3445357 RepID=UPI003EE8636C
MNRVSNTSHRAHDTAPDAAVFQEAVELGSRLALRPMGARVAALYETTTVAALAAGLWDRWSASAAVVVAVASAHGVLLHLGCRYGRTGVAATIVVLLPVTTAFVVGVAPDLGAHNAQLVIAVLVSGSVMGLSISVGPWWGVLALVVGVAGWALLLWPAGRAVDLGVVFTGAVFTAALGITASVMVRRGAKLTERLMTAAETSLAARAVADARWLARMRHNRTLHDTVLSTLTVLAHGGGGLPADVVRQSCRRDADALAARLEAPSTPSVEVAVDADRGLWSEVRRTWAVRSLGVEVFGDAAALALDGVRAEVVAALSTALDECLTNVAEHSGVSVATVSVQLGRSEVHCAVVDEGRGFDPAAVAPDRLGLAESVRGRLHDVGGTAAVFSRVGEGTTVLLTVPRDTGPGR